ncbi:MAG: formylglycine-generating enzyme family protein [Leptolyngbya sp. PLA3]|nr:MAG: formylglycine-generating enzyme family protein [Cyanobacteria bacterium CYA]MCE7968125.1 formylglycine-generating enzyme family protein [Leptolyngbya sp. PL-A3]
MRTGPGLESSCAVGSGKVGSSVCRSRWRVASRTGVAVLTCTLTAHAPGLPEPGEPLGAASGRRPGERLVLQLAEGVQVELAWIPAGAFEMGSPKDEEGHDANEGPRHAVRITSGFWMMTTEVRQDQWEAMAGPNRSRFQDDPRKPVETVDWYEAVEFANRVTQAIVEARPDLGLKPTYEVVVEDRLQDGRICDAAVSWNRERRGFRLPTEAEWEYACRAGTSTPFHTGELIASEQANFNGAHVYGEGEDGVYRGMSTVAGSFPANAWGLHDMHGNVSEWCWDRYDAEYYASEAAANENQERVDPIGPDRGAMRVIRGGSWVDGPWFVRSGYRTSLAPIMTFYNHGFRLVLDGE